MSEIKRPLTAILIAPDSSGVSREDIISGRVSATIRQGWRDYKVGDQVMLCCHIVPWCVKAKVESVSHLRVQQVSEYMSIQSGYSNQEDMISQLKVYYPDFGVDSLVTLIFWSDVQGSLKNPK